MKPEDIELLAYIEISEHRAKILKILNKKMMFPSKIAKQMDLRTNEVSRLLKGLKEKELVVCINEEAKVGRFYKITDKGKEIIENL
ncbi:MAG: winged helix-turn-helix domain-containing protein [Methanobacteriaceae archaeon]